MDHTSPLLIEREAAAYLRLSEGKLRFDRVQGVGPTYVKLGRSVRYRLSDIDHWLEERRRTSTREHGVQQERREAVPV